MPKLGPIDFDDSILDALRDDKLVMFAGAGVSMGPPSSLASFRELVSDIAEGTGQVVSGPLDRFLGQLHHKKVAVHERAAKFLSPQGSLPNDLHHNLLRVFRSAKNVRLVTTNFDFHFETAAQTVFGSMPEVYRAPALPLGRDLHGIVHIHGSLASPNNMVLTDADFGRAYLTEGWARRFLVELFRNYTVLFVGYSHDDVVMNYLARALPADGDVGRFALTDENGSWDLLGIKPIRFKKETGVDSYRELYKGVERLAEHVTRGTLDWQTRMAEIGRGIPPADEETIGEIEQGLRQVHTTRFLTNVARDSEWPKWLNTRNHLKALFCAGDLNERDRLLASWLAQNFVIEHPAAMFDLVCGNGMQLNPLFWWSISRELGLATEKLLEEKAPKGWVTILLTCMPAQSDCHAMMWLAERCASQGVTDLALRIFLSMSKHRLTIKPGFVWQDQNNVEHGQGLDVRWSLYADHWSLNELWTKHLKPHLALISQNLLSGVTHRFEEIHYDLMAWDRASSTLDPISNGRSAIEPHGQDSYPESIDVLIDAARDVLEWIGADSSTLLDAWIEMLVKSDVPILRRLAVHAISVHPGMTADEKLLLLIDRIGLHGLAEYHEVYHVVGTEYPMATGHTRQAIVDAICAHRLPASGDWSAEKATARSHFDWLSWLLRAKADCQLAAGGLAPIKAEYPNWEPSDHPDFTHWHGPVRWVSDQSPFSSEQLLNRAPHEQLDELLMFTGSHFDGPNRDGLIKTVKEACKQQVRWAFALSDALVEGSRWSSDLWPAVIQGWQEADLTMDDWRTVLATVAQPELQAGHAYHIANLLYSIVRDGGKPFALDLLEQANAIALPTWQSLDSDERDEEISHWLTHAINRPAGIVVEFWINGLSLFVRGKTGPERNLPDDYKQWFTLVVQDPTSKGGLGRSLLASQTAFLFGLDEVWTRQHIIPLFSDENPSKFRQAWDGFLTWGRLYPALAEVLLPAFISAVGRHADFSDRRHRFVEFYTAFAVFHLDDPIQNLLPALFQHGSVDDRTIFASRLGHFLRQMQSETKQQLWDRWLFEYWEKRRQGIPASLVEAEIRQMLDWLLYLDGLFPKAVPLIVGSGPIQIEHSLLLHELRNSDLVMRYPAETAELLIYLCSCVITYQVADLRIVAGRLPSLTPDLRRRLDEGLARIGA